MFTKKDFIILVIIGFFLALLLQVLEFKGWFPSLEPAVYIIYYPIIILWSINDIILEKMGYHPSIFGPDDVPTYLGETVFISLVIIIPFSCYLLFQLLKNITRTRVKI